LTVLGPDDHRLDGSPAEVERALRRLRSIGRPLPDVEVRIVDEDGRVLGADEVGEIHVRTPRAMKGYAGGADSPFTADGWLPTRDLGWVDADGYLYVAGRKDDMIIRGGENIAPAEIEDVLMRHPAVKECAVVGVADDEWGQRIAAAVVLVQDDALVDREELRAWVREQLRSSKTPDVIEIRTMLPYTDSGKLLRREVRASFTTAPTS
jgi:acyl-CoA synthetase (AMP-forming)/AMP-acid ligase II